MARDMTLQRAIEDVAAMAVDEAMLTPQLLRTMMLREATSPESESRDRQYAISRLYQWLGHETPDVGDTVTAALEALRLIEAIAPERLPEARAALAGRLLGPAEGAESVLKATSEGHNQPDRGNGPVTD